ncbi:MAG: DNA polymerase III subunit gamma/tau [Solirubrobacteraceae bacterium]
MSSGPSLYRRHRPRVFADVVGQEHVVRTLANAVERDRIHHAYLFVGSRGTGKTSMAKILAACLNCVEGPTITPCGVCESCRSIAAATSLDVVEMDAASSNSVDDIRALRESVAFAPVSGQRKVYILDEAHMLSSAAWNAFLKTLEEPPPNTVFVLATTDAQKIPATVIDRCHRFDFGRPSAEQILQVLRRTASAESIEVGDEALALLARHAAGSFRDALGTLEQLQTYSEGAITLDDVLAVLGISDAELLFATFDAIVQADPATTLRAVASAIEAGTDPATFTRELEAHARELLIVQTTAGSVPPEISLTPERDARLQAQATQVGPATLVRFLDVLAQALIANRAGADARTQLELATIRAARPDLDPSTAAITARLERLERNPPRASEASPAPPARQPPPPLPPEHPAATQPPPPQPEEPSAPPATAGEPSGDDLPLTLQLLLDAWPAVLATLRSSNALLGAVIEEAQPVEFDGSRLVLAFAEDAAFQRRKAEDRASRTALAEAVTQVTGRAVSLDYASQVLAPKPPVAPLSNAELAQRLVDEFDGEQLPAQAEKEID